MLFALCSELGMLPSEIEGADPPERAFLYAALSHRNKKRNRELENVRR